MARKTTQAYTEEFRREAVKRSEKECNTTASVARELGVSAIELNQRYKFIIEYLIRCSIASCFS